MSDTAIKQCTKKDKCINPLGSLLPSTTEYFYPDKRKKDGLTVWCRVCMKKQSREYMRDHREEQLKRNRKHYLENKHIYYAQAKSYRERFPERIKEAYRKSEQRYTERERTLPRDFIDKDRIRARQWWNDNCAYCGELIDWAGHAKKSFDHFITLSDPRPDNPGTVATNMLPCCIACNCSKSDKNAKAWLDDRYGELLALFILTRIEEYFQWVRDTRDYSKRPRKSPQKKAG